VDPAEVLPNDPLHLIYQTWEDFLHVLRKLLPHLKCLPCYRDQEDLRRCPIQRLASGQQLLAGQVMPNNAERHAPLLLSALEALPPHRASSSANSGVNQHNKLGLAEQPGHFREQLMRFYDFDGLIRKACSQTPGRQRPNCVIAAQYIPVADDQHREH